MERMEAVVSGRVQGVGYRNFVQQKAMALNLMGEAENLKDKTVRVIAEGPRENLERLIVQLHHGPFFAHVVGVLVSWNAPTSAFKEFSIR